MTETQTTAKATTTRHCQCGCGEATSSSKTLYKPGHDARHVGVVARSIAEAKINGEPTAAHSLQELGSPKLIAKADAMAKRIVERVAEQANKAKERANRKPAQDRKSKADAADEKAAATLAEKVAAEEAAHAEAEAAKQAEREAAIAQEEQEAPVSGEFTVKLGRWEYPARYAQDGTVERNSKRDGSGEWIEFNGTI